MITFLKRLDTRRRSHERFQANILQGVDLGNCKFGSAFRKWALQELLLAKLFNAQPDPTSLFCKLAPEYNLAGAAATTPLRGQAQESRKSEVAYLRDREKGSGA